MSYSIKKMTPYLTIFVSRCIFCENSKLILFMDVVILAGADTLKNTDTYYTIVIIYSLKGM